MRDAGAGEGLKDKASRHPFVLHEACSVGLVLRFPPTAIYGTPHRIVSGFR